MKKETELKANEYIAQVLVNTYPGRILAASAVTEENYGVDDIWFTASTSSVYPMECKRIKGGYGFMEDGEFRDYFSRDIYKKLRFETDITSGTPVYFVNAEDRYGNEDNGKWARLMVSGACLSFLAADGMVIYNPEELREALVGFADYLVSHTSEFGKKGERHWERKAVVDLSKGTFIPCNPPDEILKK